MFMPKVPRVFIIAGCVLVFLISTTNHYLFQHYTGATPGSKQEAANHGASSGDSAALGKKPFAGNGVGSGGVPPIISGPEFNETDNADASQSSPLAGPSLQSGDDQNSVAADSSSTTLLPGQCPELSLLKRAYSEHRLSKNVRYKRICVKPVFSLDAADRNAVANISESLFGGETPVDMDNCHEAELPECTRVALTVPRPYSDFVSSHLLFGVSTTYARLQDSVDAFAHWLSRATGDGPKLIVLLVDIANHDETEVEALQQEYRDAGVNAHLVGSTDSHYSASQSHFTVIEHMLNSSDPETRWYALLDDDTFFPRGLKPLSDALATLDHTRDQYVGALSEDFAAVRTWGFMAFGGAGIYLSAPLAGTLGKQLRKCMDEATSREGDIITRECVYHHSKAKLTILPGLYQQDFKGDASGFFEAGLQPINLHHWKSWYNAPVVKMAAATFYCGDCFLQRWRFGTDAVLTNGYSISRYIYDVDVLDLDRMEATWDDPNEDYDFSIGPFRRKLVPGEKKSYKLEDIDFSGQERFKQMYVWRGAAASEPDGVIELIWRS